MDAVCIGTWPYLHREVTCAALEAGKHVLCEARMAMDLGDARAMLQASREHPELVAQVVPTPLGLPYHQAVREFIDSGGLGRMLAVEVRDVFSDLLHPAAPLRWRQRLELAGYNYVTLGQWWETLLLWAGPVSWLDAAGRIVVASKDDPETGETVQVQLPDHITVLAEFENGAVGTIVSSAVTGNVPESMLLLHGDRGTLKYDALTDTLWWSEGHSGSYSEMPVDPKLVGGWRAEEEFINAVRGRGAGPLYRLRDRSALHGTEPSRARQLGRRTAGPPSPALICRLQARINSRSTERVRSISVSSELKKWVAIRTASWPSRTWSSTPMPRS